MVLSVGFETINVTSTESPSDTVVAETWVSSCSPDGPRTPVMVDDEHAAATRAMAKIMLRTSC